MVGWGSVDSVSSDQTVSGPTVSDETVSDETVSSMDQRSGVATGRPWKQGHGRLGQRGAWPPARP
jgi:hypothetical protein